MAFKILRKNCCGLDVHKTWIFACIGITDSNGRTEYKRTRFPSFSKWLQDLAIISPDGDSGRHGQNAYFYDSAERLLIAVILLLAEFLPLKEINGQFRERRHIVYSFYQEVIKLSKPRSAYKEFSNVSKYLKENLFHSEGDFIAPCCVLCYYL